MHFVVELEAAEEFFDELWRQLNEGDEVKSMCLEIGDIGKEGISSYVRLVNLGDWDSPEDRKYECQKLAITRGWDEEELEQRGWRKETLMEEITDGP